MRPAPIEAYLHTKWHHDPSNRLATMHQPRRHTDKQDRTGQDRQWFDSVGRTVLQTVAQRIGKRFKFVFDGVLEKFSDNY